MEQRGLLQRKDCPEDGRGSFVVIAPPGRTALEEAAPGHVRAVRRLMLDRLSPSDEEALDRILGGILEELEGVPEARLPVSGPRLR
jgi:DNA-binding MarR family transcriptional regulator